MRLSFATIVLIFFLCTPLALRAEEDPLNPSGPPSVRYPVVVDVVFKPGDERTLGSIQYMMPMYQREDRMIFMDLRTTIDDRSSYEGNAGIGYRQMVKNKAIYGGYGFMDRRHSPAGNDFVQTTFGAERLTESNDLRMNVYLPLTDEQRTGTFDPALSLSGTNVIIDEGEIFEEALRGFDIEAGVKLPWISEKIGTTRAFGQFFRFDGDLADGMAGTRGRFYTEPRSWLRLGGEIRKDSVRGTNTFAEIRVRLPFGGTPVNNLSGLQKRMIEPIERDIDIVTDTGRKTNAYNVMDDPSGEQVNVYTVDNTVTTSGDGSFDAPFQTLAEAEAAAGPGDTIYVRNSGTAYDPANAAGITLDQPRQRLIGQGVALTLDATNFDIPTNAKTPASQNILQPATSTPPSPTPAATASLSITP